MRNIHRTTNQGLQRLVESYTPRVSEYDVLDFLKKKGFDPSSQMTKNYASGVAEYLNYPENDDYDLKSWYKDTLMNYPEDLEELPKLNEALSPEAKANNEMIQKILNKKPSQLTAKEKKFLADNDLVRDNGTGGDYPPSIRKNGASWSSGIRKGDSDIRNRNNRMVTSKFTSIDDVDQLNLLKKRDERSRARYEADKDPDILATPNHSWGQGRSELQKFNKDYADTIKRSKKYAKNARDFMDSYIETGGRLKADLAKHNANASRVLKDQAKKSLEYRPKFESLEDSDYQDFLHSLSEVVTKESKKWKDRGISISDVYNALDDLSVRYEDLSDEDLEEALDFKTMPISKEGATFAFKATVDEPEVSRLLKKKGLRVDKINEDGTLVWLIGNADTNHVATYVPSTKTLYTDRREIFREALSLKKR